MLLKLPAMSRCVQVTLVDTRVDPQEAYTVLGTAQQVASLTLGTHVVASSSARVQGTFSVWVLTAIRKI